MTMMVDPDRAGRPETGIYVRAQLPGGKWISADINWLARDDLLAWLRAGNETRAIDVVGMLLGHGHLVEPGLCAACEAAGYGGMCRQHAAELAEAEAEVAAQERES